MPMENCLQNFDEKFCFAAEMKDIRFQNGFFMFSASAIVTVLRQYDHCPILHPIRGIGEVCNWHALKCSSLP